jgi:hypothetical protein
MTDEFFKRVNEASEVWFGEGREPEAIVRDFDLYGHTKRAEALTSIDQHIRSIGDVGRGENELREYGRLVRLRSELGAKHQTLMKVGR